MTSLHTRDVDRIFTKLKMEIEYTHHKVGLFRHDGKVILRTQRSHGKGEIKGNIPFEIRKQLKLTSKEFSDLLNCEFKREGYIDILREKGILD